MYELPDYLAMIADRRRTSAYMEAMARVITPGDHVLELGTGFGYFAVYAARLGAAHVWAVEPNDVIGLGPQLAERHGVGDRITFIQDLSTRVTLPERATVLLEDMRGTSPLLRGRVPALLDARERLLEPGARRIPVRDRLMLAPARERAREGVGGRSDIEQPFDGEIDISDIVQVARAAVQGRPAPAIEVAAEAACWTTLDYESLSSADADGHAQFVVTRPGPITGLASWFVADLGGGVSFDTGPDFLRSVYDCGWLPLERPLDARAGDRLTVRVRAKFDGADYVWAWDTVHEPALGGARIEFRQSNLRSLMLSPARVARRAGAHVPVPRADTRRAADALQLVDGSRTVAAIAHELRAREPGRFPDEREAIRWVADVLAAVEERA